ncbi:hypothetical protein CBP21_00880 [Fischerella thermalis WC246]|nr:hypothetical protein CBP21_00880 [Fischerella thermalis WC246]
MDSLESRFGNGDFDSSVIAKSPSDLEQRLEPTFRTQNWHTEKALSKSRRLVKIETIKPKSKVNRQNRGRSQKINKISTPSAAIMKS